MQTHQCLVPQTGVFEPEEHYFTCPKCQQDWEFRANNFDGYWYQGKWVPVYPIGQEPPRRTFTQRLAALFR